MVVQHARPTRSARSRKTTLELLLSEHRVACTTCDADGDCLLQDYAYEYQAAETRFPSVMTPPGQPNYTTGNKGIEYDPSKCVRCQRCVQDLRRGGDGRGPHAARPRRARAGHHRLRRRSSTNRTCELCGLCVEHLPDRPPCTSAFAEGLGRAKELVKVRTTCTYCGVGLPDGPERQPAAATASSASPAEPGCVPNDGNLCVKGHFGFQFIHSPERLTTPLIRENGSVPRGLVGRGHRLRGRRAARHPRRSTARTASRSSVPRRCTNEENYLMQKLARARPGGPTTSTSAPRPATPRPSRGWPPPSAPAR